MTSPFVNRFAQIPLAKWVDAGNGWVPQSNTMQAIVGGYDISGENLYIGRGDHLGNLIPGKVNPNHGCCYVAYDGSEHAKNNYQVLTRDLDSSTEFEWVNAADGQVPSNALQGGLNEDGEKLYIGRAQHEGSLVVGKIVPSRQNLYISFGGGEHSYRFYECLCIKEK